MKNVSIFHAFHNAWHPHLKRRFFRNSKFVRTNTGCTKCVHSNVHTFQIPHSQAFSLVEMLMALLVTSLLMAALAPVMTKKFSENVNVTGSIGISPDAKKHVYEIEFGSDECSEIKTDADGSEYCEGEFEVPPKFNGNIKATVIAAGGGGGVAPTAGYTEYTTPGTKSFIVPYAAGNLEVTLVEGGGGGGAGYVDSNVKGYAWTHSGTLDRNYVSTNDVSANVINVKVPGDSVSAAYSHGETVLKADELKYVAANKVFLTMAGGGGGGGRGYAGTGGGGGAAYKRQSVAITKGVDYNIGVGAGGRGHACNGSGGCGGSASNFGTLLITGGGGGGAWPMSNPIRTNATAGEHGGTAASIMNQSCIAGGKAYFACSGGGGAYPNSTGGVSNASYCGGSDAPAWLGTSGGNSLFGYGGVYGSTNPSGRGYGSGGCGAGSNPDAWGSGAPGFVAAEWHNFANGGAGGGAGSMTPLQRVKTTPNETLSIIIGSGGKGGAAANINAIGSYTKPENGGHAGTSYLRRGSTNLLMTSYNGSPATVCNTGACGGDTSGICINYFCSAGWVHDSNGSGFDHSTCTFEKINGFSYSANSKYPGFKAEAGFLSGNHYNDALPADGSVSKEDGGGNGAQSTIFGKKLCSAGTGSTISGTPGGDASGYGGCGGGGGYGIAKGGDGAGGYARISWNKYFDTVNERYKAITAGAGGGGAGGSTFTFNTNVKAGEMVKIRIGKGGNGAYIANNILIEAKKGGDTVFGDIKARGGDGGKSVSNNTSDGSIINGSGGNIAATGLCKFKDEEYSRNNKYCIKGQKGSDADGTKGGTGGGFAGYTQTTTDKDGNEIKKEFKGEGGKGGILDSGENTNGKNANGYAAGGGGASIRDLGEVNSASQANITNNQNRGGNGANGKILLEWWQ